MKTSLCWVALILCILHCVRLSAAQDLLPNCSYPAVYAFGDGLTDVGNAIAAFPEKFAHAELDPNGIEFPMHPADRFCDGKLLVDFLAFGVRRRPIYPVLRGTSPDFRYGTNFAAVGGSARNVTLYSKASGPYYTPFSLDVQLQWFERYKIRLWFYEYMNPGIVVQPLPTLNSINQSLFLVYAGYQDYFYSLYDKTLTPRQALNIVEEVVESIGTLIEGMLKVSVYYPPGSPSYVMPAAKDILVLGLPPLGCIPAMLTIYQTPGAKYNSHGCLSDLNKITTKHNRLLGEKVIALREKYPDTLRLLYGDIHGVYTDILKNPEAYSKLFLISHPP
uniref:GDSL esterase/lipase n=1 Tax=Physcomitrium patens TaxID=3218 RepID=A0A7I4BN57_PHYPA